MKTFFKKLKYRLLVETTKIENTSFPFKTALSETNVKTNRMAIKFIFCGKSIVVIKMDLLQRVEFCQKPMLRQIEWQLQNGPITKSGVLPVTTLFFWKNFSSFRTS